jgi:hypothetical protein
MMAQHPGEPLGIPISDVHLYGGPSRSVAFEAVKDGRLESYRVGRVRMVTMASLRRFIAAAVAAERAS